MSIFAKKLRKSHAGNPLQETVSEIQRILNSNAVATPSVTAAALAMESYSDHDIQALNTATDTLATSLESIARNLNLSIENYSPTEKRDSAYVSFANKYTQAQLDAAVVAGTLVGDIPSFLSRKIDPVTVSTETMRVVNPVMGDDASFVRPAMEAYDERENRNAAAYSIAYNMEAARQDEFGETFFPTIVVSPDNIGFSITVRLMVVMNDLFRKVTGELDNFNRINIIRAIADYTVLKNEMTRIVPVYRTSQGSDSSANFSTAVGHSAVLLEGESIDTGPLLFGRKMNLLGLSQTDTLLANGIMDVTDAIDPAIKLENIYATFSTGSGQTLKVDVVGFNVENLPLSTFTYSVQNNYRIMSLNFETTSLLITKDTIQADKSVLDALGAIVTDDLAVRLEVVISGSIDVQKGDTALYANRIALHSITDNVTGAVLDLTAPANATIVGLFDTMALDSFTVKAYRTNSNRRQRGQLIDTTYYTELYNVPLRSPITAIHPETQDRQGDAGDLASLITATRIRTSNAAVTALLNGANLLSSYVNAKDSNNAIPDILGAGRWYVLPKYYEKTIDMREVVDSLTSTNRPEDVQNAIVNKIRDAAYRLYTDSEYKAAADALNGGIARVPTVIIGTDPTLARYLNVTGDLRTLGGMFDVRIVPTLDYRMRGKIVFSFGVFDENRNVEPNPLNFGSMAWSSEVVVNLPISRNGQISRELSVSPRFMHIQNLPIMGVLNITHLEDVLNKVTVNTYGQVLTVEAP